MTYRTQPITLALAGIVVAFATGAASAKDAVKSAPHALPGVDTGYSIVKPIPESDETADTANSDRHFKVGNTEVRIGGYIRIDIGAGSPLRSRH